MREGVIVTGVLGLGTGLVFAAAALVASVAPSGMMVGGSFSTGIHDAVGWPAPGGAVVAGMGEIAVPEVGSAVNTPWTDPGP